MSNSDFKVIVCAAIKNKDNKIFMARRKEGKILGGFWEFPGGKLEHGEEVEAALKREIQEELSIEVSITRLLHIQPHQYDHGAVLILFYEALFQTGEIQLIDHDEMRWCEASELHNLKLLPANKQVLKVLNSSH